MFTFPYFVASRYLLTKGEARFASFLTLVAISGVGIGIAALIVVLSVMQGFSGELESKLMGFNPHITIISPESDVSGIKREIEKEYGNFIEEINVFATGEIIVHAEGQHATNTAGAKAFGYEEIPERIRKSAKIYMVSPFFFPWIRQKNPDLKNGVVLGNEMIYQIGVFPDMGSSVQLISPFGGIDPLGNPIPVRREYPVTGGFRSGFFEYDVKYLMMPFNEAKRLLGMQGRYGLQIMLTDLRYIPEVTKNLQKDYGGNYNITGWTDKNKKLFAALKLERMAMTFLLGLIIVIASFSVVGVVLMLFFSKRKDLAVMLSLGASKKTIERVFVVHGGLIGLLGSMAGLVVGVAVCLIVREGNILLPPSYYLDHLPVKISGWLISLISIGGIVVSIMASYYPARRASQLDPVKLLRGE